MSSNSETKAQKYLREAYGDSAYIKKIPDFKQTGSMIGGMPDYLVVYKSKTYWYEVKQVTNRRKSIGMDDFTPQQLIEFRKLLKAGAKVIILIYNDNDLYIADFKDLYYMFAVNKSVKILELGQFIIKV